MPFSRTRTRPALESWRTSMSTRFTGRLTGGPEHVGIVETGVEVTGTVQTQLIVVPTQYVRPSGPVTVEGTCAAATASDVNGRWRYPSICVSAIAAAVEPSRARLMERMPELKPATSAAMPTDVTTIAINSSISVMPSCGRSHLVDRVTGM